MYADNTNICSQIIQTKPVYRPYHGPWTSPTHVLFWVSYASVLYLVFALAKRSWACFTFKNLKNEIILIIIIHRTYKNLWSASTKCKQITQTSPLHKPCNRHTHRLHRHHPNTNHSHDNCTQATTTSVHKSYRNHMYTNSTNNTCTHATQLSRHQPYKQHLYTDHTMKTNNTISCHHIIIIIIIINTNKIMHKGHTNIYSQTITNIYTQTIQISLSSYPSSVMISSWSPLQSSSSSSNLRGIQHRYYYNCTQ